jgi:hypothetical protein
LENAHGPITCLEALRGSKLKRATTVAGVNQGILTPSETLITEKAFVREAGPGFFDPLGERVLGCLEDCKDAAGRVQRFGRLLTFAIVPG